MSCGLGKSRTRCDRRTAFNLLETQFGFSGIDSNFLVAKAIQHSACVIETLWLRFSVDEHQADLVLHTALKVKVSSF